MTKKIAADRNYRMMKRAFRDPTIMTLVRALENAGWSQTVRADGIYFVIGEESLGNEYEVKMVVTKKPQKEPQGEPK